MEKLMHRLSSKIDLRTLEKKIPAFSVETTLDVMHFTIIDLFRFTFDPGEDPSSFAHNTLNTSSWEAEDEPLPPKSDVFAGDTVPLYTREVPASPILTHANT